MSHPIAESRRVRRQKRGAAWLALPVLLVVASSTGCASSLMPTPGRRLSLVIDHGNLAYMKEGRKFSSGPFGGEIEEAVQGVPAAEEHAQAYKTERTAGVVATVLGLLGVGVGLGVYGSAASHDSNNSNMSSGQAPPPDPTGLWVAVGGLVVETIGVLLEQDSTRHLFDAINVYNDAVLDDATPPGAPRTSAPKGAPPPAPVPATPTVTDPDLSTP